MDWYTLDEICEDVTVGHVGPTSEFYADDGIPFLRTQNVGQGVVIRNDIKRITLDFHKKLKKSTLRKGDVILSRVISDKINFAVVPEDLDGANCANIVIVRPDKKLVSEYLAYYIGSANVQNSMMKHSVGSAQSVVNVQVVKDWKIPLPPLTEQKRIASLLVRADRLRHVRRTAHDLGDELLQSVFLEMFGDALTGKNSKIPLVPLETLCTKITDGTHVTPNYIDKGVPFISIKDLTKTPGKIDFSSTKFISQEEHEKISKLSNVERDDILYTKVGSYGIAQIVDTDRAFSIFVSIALLKPDKAKILPKFFEVVMNSNFVKRQADKLVSGIGVPDCMSSKPLGQRGQFAKVWFPGQENYTAGGCRFCNRLCCRVCCLIWSRFVNTSLALPK